MSKTTDLAEVANTPIDDVFGMWANRKDLEDDWLANGRSRWQSTWSDTSDPDTPNPNLPTPHSPPATSA